MTATTATNATQEPQKLRILLALAQVGLVYGAEYIQKEVCLSFFLILLFLLIYDIFAYSVDVCGFRASTVHCTRLSYGNMINVHVRCTCRSDVCPTHNMLFGAGCHQTFLERVAIRLRCADLWNFQCFLWHCLPLQYLVVWHGQFLMMLDSDGGAPHMEQRGAG